MPEILENYIGLLLLYMVILFIPSLFLNGHIFESAKINFWKSNFGYHVK
jgi:hypothetical protein